MTPADISGIIAFEKLFRRSPNLRDFRVFDCLAYRNTRPFNRIKTMNRHISSYILGYLNNINGYLCLNLESRRLVVSRDVIFIEDDFSENVKLQSTADHFDEDFCREYRVTQIKLDRPGLN